MKQNDEKSTPLAFSEEDRQVELALLKRALGYKSVEVVRQMNSKTGEFEVVKTVEKDVMPSTTAQMFWLKNKCGYAWDEGMCDEETGGVVMLPMLEEEKGE